VKLPVHRVTTTGSAPNAARSRGRNLILRTISALVLAPLVVAAAYAGGWIFLLLCLFGAAGILWEWGRLVSGRPDAALLVPGLAALVAAVALTGMDKAGGAAAIIAMGALVAALAFAVRSSGYVTRYASLWAAGGVIYAGVALLGPALLRRDGALGFTAFVFLAASVWTTDIFAYGVGRAIGGPLLWPRVSPNKTWAGAIGGLAGGVAAGILVAYASGIVRLAALGVVALVLSAFAQAGDLLESAIKRRFGAKDAGGLIPGHGGLMDRLDGFLVAAFVALLIGVIRQGSHAPAHGLLVW
jgi:phosphatidate cytidylyltransferase